MARCMWLLTFASIIALGRGDTICFADLADRCFTNDPPYDNVNNLPDEPSEIDTTFWLYTKDNPTTGQNLVRTKDETLLNSDFNVNIRTKFIIHGWLNDGITQGWMYDMKDALLQNDDVNVIITDWGEGARKLYDQSVANTRVVGAEAELLARWINSIYPEYTYPDMHCIGHSLGGHTCGYMGEGLEDEIPAKLGNISGLDPAGPRFENEHELVRVDPKDAQFVEVMHTDGDPLYSLGLGIWRTCGHVDFYPNGGEDQPGCPLVGDEICDHMRAVDYYYHSISPTCVFKAYPCDISIEDCKLDAPDEFCNEMGYRAQPKPEGIFFVITADDEPYCID
ncbi:pancreatic lipase-related protein 2-like [Saccoglossus kowalevskii]